ncbi:hypothetical protein EAW52_25610 [Pseudomonas sp. LTJR-52]|nr:hypothetical protein EAW52_25610 [Pseudomonas sp. LTJR-52]
MPIKVYVVDIPEIYLMNDAQRQEREIKRQKAIRAENALLNSITARTVAKSTQRLILAKRITLEEASLQIGIDRSILDDLFEKNRLSAPSLNKIKAWASGRAL